MISPRGNIIISNPSIKKVVNWVFIILIIVIVIVIIMRIIKKAKEKLQDQQLVNSTDSAIISNALTYTQADYKAMADKLFSAMDGAGTNENSIIEVLGKLRTKSDWYALVKAFGVKKSSSWLSGYQGNLVQWLNDELDDEERKMVNDILAKFDTQI